MNSWNKFWYWFGELIDEIFGKPIEIPPEKLQQQLKDMRERIEQSETAKKDTDENN